MKKISNTLTLIALTLFLASFTNGINNNQIINEYDPSGTWKYEVETEQGTLSDTMVIKKEKKNYTVTIDSQVYGQMKLDNVTYEKEVLKGNSEIQGDIVDFEMEFDGDTMKGTVYVGQNELDITAKREK